MTEIEAITDEERERVLKNIRENDVVDAETAVKALSRYIERYEARLVEAEKIIRAERLTAAGWEASYDRASEELPALKAASSWRPIEEAPRDGTEILGIRWNPHFGARWEPGVISWYENTWKVNPTKDGRLSHLAEYWKPIDSLPPPPVGKEE